MISQILVFPGWHLCDHLRVLRKSQLKKNGFHKKTMKIKHSYMSKLYFIDFYRLNCRFETAYNKAYQGQCDTTGSDKARDNEYYANITGLAMLLSCIFLITLRLTDVSFYTKF